MSCALDDAVARLDRACSTFLVDTPLLRPPLTAPAGSSTGGESGRQSALTAQMTVPGEASAELPAFSQPPISLQTSTGLTTQSQITENSHVTAEPATGWIGVRKAVSSLLLRIVRG
jgi:hypothetical protein